MIKTVCLLFFAVALGAGDGSGNASTRKAGSGNERFAPDCINDNSTNKLAHARRRRRKRMKHQQQPQQPQSPTTSTQSTVKPSLTGEPFHPPLEPPRRNPPEDSVPTPTPRPPQAD